MSKKTKVWLEPDEKDGHRVHYSVPFEEPYNTSYYYFQLSFLRMAREYSGTLRVAYELMQKFNISFTLAMVVSYTENNNRYSLHIAYPPSDNIPVVATACAIREYLGLLRDPEKEKDAWGYNTTDSIEKIARDNNNTRKECQEFLSGNNYKQLNKLVLQEVYNG